MNMSNNSGGGIVALIGALLMGLLMWAILIVGALIVIGMCCAALFYLVMGIIWVVERLREHPANRRAQLPPAVRRQRRPAIDTNLESRLSQLPPLPVPVNPISQRIRERVEHPRYLKATVYTLTRDNP